MRIRFTVFGCEVWTLECSAVDDADVPPEGVITGGAGHDFERADDELIIEEERFGFHRRVL